MTNMDNINYDYAISEWYGKFITDHCLCDGDHEDIAYNGKLTECHLSNCTGCELCEGDINF